MLIASYIGIEIVGHFFQRQRCVVGKKKLFVNLRFFATWLRDGIYMCRGKSKGTMTTQKPNVVQCKGLFLLAIVCYLFWQMSSSKGMHVVCLFIYFCNYYQERHNWTPMVEMAQHFNIFKCKRNLCRELTRNFQHVRNKKIEKTHTKEKTITSTRQYLRSSAICLRSWSCRDFTIIREKIQSTATVFHTLSRRQQQQNPNHQNGFYILRTRFTMGYKTGQKPPLHGLSLRKSLIKKPRNIISCWVGSSTRSNTN